MGYAGTRRGWLLSAASLVCGVAMTTAHAFEPGYPGWSMPPGAVMLSTAAPAASPGVYSSNMFYSQQTSTVGPGADKVSTQVDVATYVSALLWSPGWTFLGASYEALIVQPFTDADAGPPVNSVKSGIHNTVISPGQLSWKLGDTGLYVRAGLSVVVPDGSITGPTGLGGIGNPWWIIQPNVSVSYLRNGWNLTANISTEFNTPNTDTGYRTGDILHADFRATKSFGQWAIGPVVSYIGQVSNDTSSAFYHNTIATDRYNLLAVGGLVGYDFGRVKLNVWATRDVIATATGGGTGTDTATITKGYKVFGNVTFKF